MSIYASHCVLPYVYVLVHKITGQFYYGYQYANKLPSDQCLGRTYFTSSKIIDTLGFNKFDFVILAEFFTAEDAYEFEQQLISENFNNPLILNQSYHLKDSKGIRMCGPISNRTKVNMRNAQLRRFSKNPMVVSESHKNAISAAKKDMFEKNPGLRMKIAENFGTVDCSCPIYRKSISNGLKSGLATETAKLNRSEANSGSNNPRALHVMFRGIEYMCQKDAITATGVSKYMMNKDPDYIVLVNNKASDPLC